MTTPIIAQKLPAFQGAPHPLTAREGFIKWHAPQDATNRGVKIEQGPTLHREIPHQYQPFIHSSVHSVRAYSALGTTYMLHLQLKTTELQTHTPKGLPSITSWLHLTTPQAKFSFLPLLLFFFSVNTTILHSVTQVRISVSS